MRAVVIDSVERLHKALFRFRLNRSSCIGVAIEASLEMNERLERPDVPHPGKSYQHFLELDVKLQTECAADAILAAETGPGKSQLVA